MLTPDRRTRGNHRRAQARRHDHTQNALLERIQAAVVAVRQRLSQRLHISSGEPQEAWFAKIQQRNPLPSLHTKGLLLLLPLWLLLLIWQPVSPVPKAAPSGSLTVPISDMDRANSEPSPSASNTQTPAPTEPVNGNWLEHEIQNGETLYAIFRKFELPGSELSRLIAIEGPDRPLTRLQAGRALFILVDDKRQIQRVEIRSFGQAVYRYDRQGAGFALTAQIAGG